MAVFEETAGVENMVLLDNCDDKKLIENLKMRLQQNIIYVRPFYFYYSLIIIITSYDEFFKNWPLFP